MRTANVQWPGQLSPNIGDFTISGSTLLIPTSQNQLFAFDLDTGAQLWVTTLTGGSEGYGNNVTTPAVVGDYIFVGSDPGFAQNVTWAWLNVLDFDGNILASFNVHQAYIGINGGFGDSDSFYGSTLLPSLSSPDPMVMFGYNNDATMAVSFDPDTATMSNSWNAMNTQPIANFEMSSTSAASSVLSGEILYILTDSPSTGWSISGLNALTGASVLKNLAGMPPAGPLTVVPTTSGFCMALAQYLCAFSFDLSSATVTDVGQNFSLTPGEIDGIIYATSVTSGGLTTYALQAVADLSDQFFVDTRFMETWSGGSRSYAYFYSVKVLGSDGLPIPFEPLTVWTDALINGGAVTATINGGAPVNLATQTSVTTDAAGDLVVQITTDTFTAPPLNISASFMLAGQSAIIWPQQALQALTIAASAGGNGGEDLATALLSAQNYGGDPILPENYRNQASVNALAEALTNLIGTSGPTMQSPRSWVPPAFFSPLQSYPGVQFLQSANGAVSIPPTVNVQAMSGNTLSVSPSSSSFGPTSPSSRAAVLFASGAEDSIKDAISDFFSDLENAGEDALDWFEVTFNEAAEELGVIITAAWKTGQKLYRDTIDTIDKVGVVVQAVFQGIGAALSDVYEWVVSSLENVFDWQQILTIAGWIQSYLAGTLDALAAQINTPSIFQQFGQNMSAAITSAGNTYKSGLGSIFPASPLVNQMAAAMQNTSQFGDVMTNWLFKELQSVWSSLASGSPPTMTSIEDAFAALQQSFASATSGDQLQQLQQTIVNLLSNPTSLFSASLPAFLVQLNQAIELFFQVAPGLVTDAENFGQAVVSALLAILQTPFDIPFLSSIISWFGSDFEISGLSVASLLIAFPANVLWGSELTASSFAPPQISLDGSSSLAPAASRAAYAVNAFYGLSGLVFSGLDLFNDATKSKFYGVPAFALTYCACEAVMIALEWGSTALTESSSTIQQLNIAGAWLDTIWIAIDLLDFENTARGSENDPFPAINCMLGVGELVLNAVEAGLAPPQDGEDLANAILSCTSCVPWMAKVLTYGESVATYAALLAIDIAGNFSYYLFVMMTSDD